VAQEGLMMETKPAHWVWVELPEDKGDPRLLDACWALMDVRAARPKTDGTLELPVLDTDPDLADLARDHTQGTDDDPITLTAVVRLAKAVLAVADRHAIRYNQRGYRQINAAMINALMATPWIKAN
jgi:hypothetical protein